MPTYEYKCNKCGNKFEEFHKKLNEPTPKCDKCNGESKRIISIPTVDPNGFLFKDKL